MRILLLGEFSGFYNNLRDGLISLGHEVDLISSGDGWKNFGEKNNIYFSVKKNLLANRIDSMILQWRHVNRLKNYDVVQLISPNIFGNLRLLNNQLLLRKICNTNNKMFLSVAGDHYYVYKSMEKLKYKIKYNSKKISNKAYKRNNDYILKLVDGIIPISYNYAEAYRNHIKLLKTIPLPINLDMINKFRKENSSSDKIRIFHGINQESVKGTKYIKEAMLKIKENYPNKVDILIDGKMPFNEYLKVLQDTDIVIDQALSYGYGMNAIYSMALGKVVMSGNELETQVEFSRLDIPVINITPSVEDIYQKLERLILDTERINEIGRKSRLFVEDFHSHVKVAQRYIDTWNSIEVRK